MRTNKSWMVGVVVGLAVPSLWAALPPGANFFTTTPCRIYDTSVAGPPDALEHAVPRLIQIAGLCGVPFNSSSVHFNMTVLNATADGDMILYSADAPTPAPPRPGALPFKAGQAKAKNGIVSLSGAGAINALATMSAGATVDLIIDVSGYFVDDQGPVAVDDSATLTEDDPATAIDVLTNDTDADGGPKAIASASDPANGTVVLTGGSPGAHTGLTYEPDPNYCNDPPGSTPDTFTYTLTPGGSTATVSVTVTCVNDDPTAVDDSATVAEDAPATTINVLANDSDPESDAFTITAVQNPSAQGGTVLITNAGADLSYQPAAGYCNTLTAVAPAQDTFTYTITGGSTATVTVTVTCDDDAPTAVDDSATVNEDSGANAIDVLANDTDPDGGTKLVDTVQNPSAQGGTVLITGGGTGVSYAPAANYCNNPPGTTLDTFTYTLTPGGDSGTVTVTVTCVDDAGTAVADSATVNEDSGANTINVIANDTDPDGGSTITAVQNPSTQGGTVLITNAGADLTYQPAANYCNNPPGTTLDTFTYTLTPGGSFATVTVTVTCVDDSADAIDDTATVQEDASATTINVMANDTDPDGGTNTITGVQNPSAQGGTVLITNAGADLTYQPAANYCNTPPGTTLDTFTYTLTPGGDTATVTVTVNCVDDDPVAGDDAATVTEDSGANAVDVLANDTDVDAGPKSVTAVQSPSAQGGTVLITGGGTGVSYAPAANYCNTPPGTTLDTFTYTLTPGGDTATVTVTVTCVDDPPVAVADAATVLEDSGANAIDVLANDTDIDGGPKLVTVAGPASAFGGTVAITGGGTGLTYAPAANYCNNPPGSSLDSFNYTITGGSSTTVTVTVTCVNDAPVPVADAFQVIGNTELRVDMVAGTTPHTPETTAGASAYEGVLDNDGDPEGDTVSVTAVLSGCADATAPFDCALTSGAVVHVDANGEFSFTPGPGDTTDSFQYTITDQPSFGTPLSANGTVTLTFFEMVWYVDNSLGAPGNGTSSSPFNAITGTNIGDTSGDGDLTDDLDDASDYIFVYFGNGTDSGQNGGLQLEASQRLLGEFAGLSIPVNLNGNGSPTVLVTPPGATDCSGGPCRPLLSNTAGSAVTASDNDGVAAPAIGTIPVEIVGMSLQGSVNAIDLTTTAALSGSSTLTVLQNVFRGAGAEGIDVNLDAGTSGTLTLGVLTNSWNLAGTHTGNAVDINRVAGTLNLNFSANSNIVSAAVAGSAVNINGGAAANTTVTGFAGNSVSGNTAGNGVVISNATFDSVAGGGVTQVDGDNLAIGASGNPVGGAGMSISGLGSLFFDDLDIFAGTSGLTVNGVAFAVTPASPDGSGTSTIDADNGAALDVSNAALDLRLADLQSNTSGSGVALSGIGANSQFRAPSGSSITKASGGGTAFSVASSGSGSTISYAGTLNVTAGAGVSLTNNSGSTISFSGGMTLSTGANTALTATGGGTLNVTDPAGATNNTISTTTGVAVNIVTPTNIGGSGVTFERITVNNGASNSATNAIVLNGTTGSFTVTGDGSTTGGFLDRDGSGGVINRTTGHSVLLTSASNVTLRQMNITNTATNTDGVNSTNGSNVILSAINFDTLGNHGWSATNLGGVNRVDNNSRFFSWNTLQSNAVVVTNTNTNFTSFTLDKSLMTTSATGAAGFSFITNGTTTGGTVTVTNSEFTLIDQNAVQILSNGSGTITAVVQSNNFHDADNTSGDGNNTLFLANAGSGTYNFTVSDNTFLNLARLVSTAAIIDVNATTTGQTGTRLVGTISGNSITNSIARRGIGFGIEANGGAHGAHDITVTGNTLTNIFSQGINVTWNSVNGGDVTGMDLEITNNVLSAVGLVGNADGGSGIEIENNSGTAGGSFGADILIQGNTVSNNNSSALGSTLELVSRSLFAGDTSTINYTIKGNSLTNANASGEVFEALNSGTAGTLNVCLDPNGTNTSNNTFNGGAGQVKLTNNFGSISIGGMAAGAQSAAAVQTHVTARNTFVSGATVVAGGVVGTFTGSLSGCTLP